jgi:hypothetical protein
MAATPQCEGPATSARSRSAPVVHARVRERVCSRGKAKGARPGDRRGALTRSAEPPQRGWTTDMKRNQTYPPPMTNSSQAPLRTRAARPCCAPAGRSSLASEKRKSVIEPTMATMYAAVATAARAVSPTASAYLTVSVPCMPAALWASTLQ